MDANTPPPAMPYSPRRRKPLFVRGSVRLALLVLLAGGGWYVFGHSKNTAPSGPPAALVRVAAVARQSVPLRIDAVGSVVAYETVGVRARVDSQVVAVNFKDGDEVKKGDVLFVLDDKSLHAQAEQLQANVARDRANLANARRQYDRAQELSKQGFATKATRDDSLANFEAAQANVGAAVAALDNVKVQLSFTRITAPISGRTGTINVTLGNNVKANDAQPMVTINQLKPIRVQAALPQNYVDTVREAMRAGPVSVTVQKQDDTNTRPLATGTLEYIDNAIDPATSTFTTRAGFANADERLWPGMFVTLSITLGTTEDALSVPEVAIQQGQTGAFVYVIVDAKALRREVKIARLQNNFAVIGSGLAVGEQVAVDGLIGLRDGIAVSIQPEAATAPGPKV